MSKPKSFTNSFHVYPFKLEDGGHVIECDETDPARAGFGLYTRNDDGHGVWLSDHRSRNDAVNAGLSHGLKNEDEPTFSHAAN